MEEFLDLSFQKRYRIIKTIFNSDNHCIHQKMLLKKLDISLITLKQTLILIQEDLVTFNCQNKLSIIFDSVEKNYTLIIDIGFKLDLVLLNYLENSCKFRLICMLLTESQLHINQTCNKLFITPSSLRRELHTLQKILHRWEINLKVTQGKISLEGKESTIRLFYSFFFLNSYGAYKWPFHIIYYNGVTELLKYIPGDIFIETSADKSVLIHYYCAISIVRMNKFFYFEETFFQLPLYRPYSKKSIEQASKFRYLFQQYVPTLPKRKKKNEIMALFSNILALGSFDGIFAPTRFFLIDATLQEKNFLKMVLEIEDCLFCLFNGEINLILYKLCIIHYKIYLYDRLLLKDIDLIEKKTVNLSVIEQEKLDSLFTILEQRIFSKPDYRWLASYKSYLQKQFAQLIEKHLSLIDSSLTLNICLYSKFSVIYLKKLITTNFSKHFQLNFVESIHAKSDIIISDIILSNNVLEEIGSTCKIAYIQSPLSDSDCKKLEELFFDIIRRKNQHE